jgi:2-keto-4-pentenoate hydratase/2-oxohepta-3-ene-1,7-dioic acid hydratase in catechol pathway
MQLMRIGPAGGEKPVVRVGEGTYVDVSDVVTDFEGAWLSGGPARLGQIVAYRATAGRVTPFDDERIGAPIARPHQILCIGLNYRDHAAETGQAVPDEPVVFVLEPGDLINTGTPPGVGMGMQPPLYLQPGDVMELGTDRLGSQRQQILPER